jgi:hypothetical protein
VGNADGTMKVTKIGNQLPQFKGYYLQFVGPSYGSGILEAMTPNQSCRALRRSAGELTPEVDILALQPEVLPFQPSHLVLGFAQLRRCCIHPLDLNVMEDFG